MVGLRLLSFILIGTEIAPNLLRSAAGGGGERVLWMSIIATLRSYPEADIVIYAKHSNEDPNRILEAVKVNITPRTH